MDLGLSPAAQIGALFLGGLALAPALIILLKLFAPGDPFDFADPETKDGAPEPPLPERPEQPEPLPDGLRKRKGARQPDALGASPPKGVEAQSKLQQALLDRAETIAPVDEFGVNAPEGLDPFMLSSNEVVKLEEMARMLFPSQSDEEIKREIANATELARQEYQATGGASLDRPASSSKGWSSRSVARCLDLVFVSGVVIAIVYVLHTEYGFQPYEAFQQMLPREAAVLSGKSHTGGTFGSWLSSVFGSGDELLA